MDRALFGAFKDRFSVKTSTIVDSAMAPVPCPRNRSKENNKIKNGRIPTAWEEDPNKLRQEKDTDTRWVMKNGKTKYDYKNPGAVDRETKLIDQWKTTEASVHDIRMLEPLLIEKPAEYPQLLTGCAYRSQELNKVLWKRG